MRACGFGSFSDDALLLCAHVDADRDRWRDWHADHVEKVMQISGFADCPRGGKLKSAFLPDVVLIGVWQMATAAAPSAFETLQQRVVRLLATWRAETAHISSSTERNAHPAYQEIISLGMAALPFLLRDLEKTRDGHLSKALTAITGVHPVQPESRGKISQVAEAWLRWAKENDLRG